MATLYAVKQDGVGTISVHKTKSAASKEFKYYVSLWLKRHPSKLDRGKQPYWVDKVTSNPGVGKWIKAKAVKLVGTGKKARLLIRT